MTVRAATPLLALMLAACAGRPAAEPSGACDAAAVAPWMGQQVGPGQILAARRASGARTVRVLRPGEAATMDYRADRLTIEVDGGGRLVKASCG